MKDVLKALTEMQMKIPVQTIVLILVISFLLSLIIYFTYKYTYNGVVYNQRFNLSIVMITLITTIVMIVIGSNISVSLGMVGALSIVRFRTAVKEPVDTIFMFWAIAAGIMAGAGLYLPSIVASLALGILFFVAYLIGFKKTNRYLLVIKYDPKITDKVDEIFNYLPKNKLRSKTSLFVYQSHTGSP